MKKKQKQKQQPQNPVKEVEQNTPILEKLTAIEQHLSKLNHSMEQGGNITYRQNKVMIVAGFMSIIMVLYITGMTVSDDIKNKIVKIVFSVANLTFFTAMSVSFIQYIKCKSPFDKK